MQGTNELASLGIRLRKVKRVTPPGGLEPPTFRLTAERANQLRHGGGERPWVSNSIKYRKLTLGIVPTSLSIMMAP